MLGLMDFVLESDWVCGRAVGKQGAVCYVAGFFSSPSFFLPVGTVTSSYKSREESSWAQ